MTESNSTLWLHREGQLIQRTRSNDRVPEKNYVGGGSEQKHLKENKCKYNKTLSEETLQTVEERTEA